MIFASTEEVTKYLDLGPSVQVGQSSVLLVRDGLTVCLSCDHERGTPPVERVQWLRDGKSVPIPDVCIRLDGDDLCFDRISRPYSGTYSCFVENIAGNDTESITISVTGEYLSFHSYLMKYL